MSSDQAQPQPLPQGSRPDWDLPTIADVAIRRAPFVPRKPRNFDSPLPAVPNACEIVVTLTAPLPIRAMAPVLLVGERPLTESEVLDKEGRRIRFWAMQPDVLKKGAPIILAWGGDEDRARANRSKFTFALPD